MSERNGVAIERDPAHDHSGSGVEGVVFEEGEMPAGGKRTVDQGRCTVALGERYMVEDTIAVAEIERSVPGETIEGIEGQAAVGMMRSGVGNGLEGGVNAKDFGFREQIRQLGTGFSQPTAEIQKAVVLSSRSEGPPSSLLEAMAAGCQSSSPRSRSARYWKSSPPEFAWLCPRATPRKSTGAQPMEKSLTAEP